MFYRVIFCFPFSIKMATMGSGCGATDRVVASDTKWPGFESSRQQFFIKNLYKSRWKKNVVKALEKQIVKNISINL